jgi:hypothetical protein
MSPIHFIATLSIVDAGGAAFEASAVVEALDKAAMDQMFTAMWGDLKTKLSNVDVVGASGLIAQRPRNDYADAWSLLAGNLPAIVASFDSFERMRIAGDHAHYVVTRTVDGQPYAFFVTFVRDGDGVWRISDM